MSDPEPVAAVPEVWAQGELVEVWERKSKGGGRWVRGVVKGQGVELEEGGGKTKKTPQPLPALNQWRRVRVVEAMYQGGAKMYVGPGWVSTPSTLADDLALVPPSKVKCDVIFSDAEGVLVDLPDPGPVLQAP